MGVHEKITLHELYLEKKNVPPRRKSTDNEFILSKGHGLEDKVRAEVELETNCDFPPEIRVHSQIDYLIAAIRTNGLVLFFLPQIQLEVTRGY